ncbi:hypothetical protein pb186bvf_020092 [Paramecium bursaria]
MAQNFQQHQETFRFANIPSQEQQERTSSKRPSKYQKVDKFVRRSLIDQVCTQGNSLRQVAQNLGVKYSTAKAIIQVYQNEGRIGKKCTRDKRIFTKLESYFILVSKKTGKISKLKIQSESSDLSKNLKQNQSNLQEIHYEELASALLSFLEEQAKQLEKNPDCQQLSQLQQLIQILTEQHKKLMA